MNIKIVELTKDNEKDYLDQVSDLEQVVLKNMEERGQIGQLFPTGKEDISSYAHSEENTVLLAIDNNEKVIAATYITQGQKPFTYNDITKYFKYGEEYNNYVKSTYKTQEEYKMDILDTYQMKIKAYKYAKQKILEQYPEYDKNIMAFLKHELNEENNRYHEKSILRELLNTYMSEYISNNVGPEHPKLQENYEKFYWFTSSEIAEEFNKTNIKPNDKEAVEFEEIQAKEQHEYEELLKKGPLIIHEKSTFDMKKYYSAKTSNSIELDTYITDPKDRREGLARILVLEGITKHMQKFFENPENKEIFLCSTLHRNNLSSKYVSEFFGLKDSLYVKRRDGRNREVHICKVDRNEYEQYLIHQRKKVAIFYGYNPTNIDITTQEKIEIFKEQLAYEKSEMERLKGAKTAQAFNGKIDFEKRKIDKVKALNKKISELQKENIEKNEENKNQDLLEELNFD